MRSKLLTFVMCIGSLIGSAVIIWLGYALLRGGFNHGYIVLAYGAASVIFIGLSFSSHKMKLSMSALLAGIAFAIYWTVVSFKDNGYLDSFEIWGVIVVILIAYLNWMAVKTVAA